MIDVESKIRSRSYQTPGRARQALTKTRVGKKDRARLVGLIEAWENEGTVDHVVAGLPEAEGLEAELVDVATGVHPRGNGARHLPMRVAVLRLNLNAAVRVQLTVAGVAKLHAQRDTVAVPPDLLERGGLWETTYWELAATLGPHFFMGIDPKDQLIVDNVIEVLDPRTVQ